MKKLLTLLIIAKSLVFSFSSFAQKDHPLIPQSPTAAAAGKYGDTDVSLYTGQINPTVKLFHIKFNDFDFPINLNYASSGLKVHEIPASTGLGTSLSCIYVVNRQVRSVPDEQTRGYNGQYPTATVVQSINNNNYTPTADYSSITEANFKLNIGKTDYDGEPDLFNVSGPTFGGKFFFDETQTGSSLKNAIFIPKQALFMSANFNYLTTSLFNPANTGGEIDKFTFYDKKGIKYTFDKKEGALLDDDEYQYGKNIVSTWYLGEILTPNGNKLTFNYIQRTIDLPHAQSEYKYLYLNSTSGLDYTTHKVVHQARVTETVLSEILINNGTWGKVEFVENTTARADWSFSQSVEKPKSLKEIVLKDGPGNIIKKYGFTYDETVTNRLLLRNITEYGKGGTTAQEPYRFDYYSESDIPTLPYEGSTSISREDHWGYYNANTTGSLLPDYDYITTNFAGLKDTLSIKEFKTYTDSLKTAQKNFTPEQISGDAASLSSFTYFVTATNRSPHFNSALIGQLQKITYPNKASSEFIYEANSYYSNQSDEFNPCAGDYQSIALATDNSAINEAPGTVNFTVPEGAFVCMKAVWSLKIISYQQDIVNGSVAIINTANGLPVFEKNLQGNNSSNPPIQSGQDFVVLPSGNYSVVADVFGENASSTNGSLVSIDVQAIPVTPNAYVTRTSGGIRIKEARDCPSNTATECLVKEYDYSSFADPTNSSGRIVTKGRYYYPIKYFSTTLGSDGFVNALYLNSASQLPLSTTMGHYVGYNNVTVKEAKILANGQKSYKGKTVFDYRSPDDLEVPNLESGTFPFWSVSKDWQRGVVEQSTAYDQSGVWVNDLENSHVLKGSSNYFKYTGLKAGKFIFNFESAPASSLSDLYSFIKYASVTGFQFNQQSIAKEQFKVKDTNDMDVLSSIESTTDYAYANNLHLQLTSSQTTTSKGETLLSQYQYPDDITVSTDGLYPSATALTNKRKISEVLRAETFKGGSSISKTENYFATFGSLVQPSLQKSFIGGSATPATESQQLSYDSYGNLTSFKENNGPTHSLMWAYNGQYPTIYVVNGVPSDPNLLLYTSDFATLNSTASSLRTTLPNAHISSYEFEPLIGLLSQTSPTGLKNSFTYEGLNRLAKIWDENGKIVKAYDYQVATTVGGNNYVKEMIPRSASDILLSGFENLQTTISYTDGLGRPLQTVAQNAGGTGANDIVINATTYSGFGTVEKTYIPFSNAGSGALAALPTSFDGDTRPFTENILFDNSPLNRLLKVRGVGDAWLTKAAEFITEASGGIKSFTLASNGEVSSSTYPANSLIKKTTINEQGNKTIEYTDKEGRLVQKEQELNATETATTAYIYNQNGQLAIMVQPKVYAAATSFNFSSALFLEGMFGYKYDAKGRQIEKHVPGAGWTRYVYDKNNRPVMENDDKDAAESPNYWKFAKYDVLDRPVMTGLIYNIGNTARQTIQDAFDAHTGNTSETTGSSVLGYSNVSFPTGYTIADANVKSVSYYDNYAWQDDSQYNFLPDDAFHDQGSAKGLVTGGLTRNLETNAWYKSVNYYDIKERPIQSFNQNHLGGINRIDNQFSFTNELLKMRMVHQGITEVYDYAYDHMGRKTNFRHTKDGFSQNIAQYTHDDVSRLSTKTFSPAGSGVGSVKTGDWTDNASWQGGYLPTIKDVATINTDHNLTINNGQTVAAGQLVVNGTITNNGTINLGNLGLNPATSDLQGINYKYHIRGGLIGINLDGSGNLTNSIFSYKLGYEADGTYFDGNIRKQEWKSNIDNVTRTYTYSYDKGSRVLSGAYTGNSTEDYSLNSVSYDLNGNIGALSRNGVKSSASFGLIDNLGYTYFDNSNKIKKVDDGSGETASFTDVAGDDYAYYQDGSLKIDANKKITLIEYNYLKLPKKIVIDGTTIETQYDAEGRKLKETIGSNVTDYIDNLIYKNNGGGQPLLFQLSHDEGRIVNNEYEYNINDHLGNLRVSFKDVAGVAQITQSNAYGVWGENLSTLAYQNTTNLNKFKYTGKEELSVTGFIDFEARLFDNIAPRFLSPDPLSELDDNQSPFNYARNNALFYTDPTGMMADSTGGSGRVSGAPENSTAKNLYQKAKEFVLSDGPNYEQMSSIRQSLNDFANSSFVKNVNEWNPYYHGMNAFSGLISEKGLYNQKMTGGDIAASSFAAFPFAKITTVAGKGIALSRASGKAMETALGMTGSKVGIKVAGKTRFPDRLNFEMGILEEAKNVKHLNYTSQLRDYLNFSQSKNLDFILYTRKRTTFSKPLEKLIKDKIIIHKIVKGF